MEKEIEKEYFELLRFESVGADPSKRRESAACASWLSRWLGNIGFAAEIIAPEDGSADVFAHFSAIGGLGGADISLNNILSTIDRLEAVKDEPGEKEVQWYLEP